MNTAAGIDERFYVSGGTLPPDAPSYVERQADIELLARLLDGDLSYVLTCRQVGKSSLMARTMRRLQERGVRVADVDLSALGTEERVQGNTSWYYGFAHQIHRKLRLTTPLSPWWNERQHLSSVPRLMEFFRDLVAGSDDRPVVVFVDEIDSLIGLTLRNDFFAAIRACDNACATDPTFGRLTFVLMGVATPDQLISDPLRTPFNVGHRIELGDFSRDEATVLATGLDRDPLRAGRALDRILYWTDGQPYLTQALCKAVQAAADDEKTLSEELVDRLVHERFLSESGSRQDSNLKNTRMRLLLKDAQGTAVLRLYWKLRCGAKAPDQPSSPVVAATKLSGAIKVGSDGLLRVRNRIYEEIFTAEWARKELVSRRWWGPPLAAASAVLLLAIALWVGVLGPWQRGQALRDAIEASTRDWYAAQHAYTGLRDNWLWRGRADALLARFWDRRALDFSVTRGRDDSLLARLQALPLANEIGPSVAITGLVGEDWPALVSTVRHQKEVNDVALSPDGTRIVTGSSDGTARVWDSTSGAPISPPLRHEGAVRSVLFSSDGARVLTGSDDKTARVWDSTTGAQVFPPLQHGANVWAVAVSSDGRRIVTGSHDRTAKVWNAVSGELLLTLAHEDVVRTVAFSPDGTRVATGSDDTHARVWDARSGALLLRLLHRDFVRAVAFSIDGRSLATGSDDRTACVWDADTGRKITSVSHEGFVWTVSFSPDGTHLLTGSWDGSARVWEANSGRLISVMRHDGRVRSAAFSPDGTRIATGSLDRTARVWMAASGVPVSPALRHAGAVPALAFTADGARVVTASADGTARVWRTDGWSPGASALTHEGGVRSAAFSGSGDRLVTGGNDATARVWDVASHALMTTLRGHERPVVALAFDADSRRVVTGSEDRTVRVWDAVTGVELAALPLSAPPNAVVFSPDGARVATASSDGVVRVWDLETGKPAASPMQHGGAAFVVAFSSDGKRIVTGGEDGFARLWDGASGAALSAGLQHAAPVRAVAFSRDGARVLTGSDDAMVRIWDSGSGEIVPPALRHEGPVLQVADIGSDVVTITRNWLTAHDLGSAPTTLRRRTFLPGTRAVAFRAFEDQPASMRVAVLDTADTVRIIDVRMSGDSDDASAVASSKSSNDWARRLSLSFDDEMRPVPRWPGAVPEHTEKSSETGVAGDGGDAP